MRTRKEHISVRTPRPGNRPTVTVVLPLMGRAPRRYEAKHVAPLEALRRIVDLMLLWRERARSRQQLLRLNDDLLKDIGLSRADVHREAVKPFWR